MSPECSPNAPQVRNARLIDLVDSIMAKVSASKVKKVFLVSNSQSAKGRKLKEVLAQYGVSLLTIHDSVYATYLLQQASLQQGISLKPQTPKTLKP